MATAPSICFPQAAIECSENDIDSYKVNNSIESSVSSLIASAGVCIAFCAATRACPYSRAASCERCFWRDQLASPAIETASVARQIEESSFASSNKAAAAWTRLEGISGYPHCSMKLLRKYLVACCSIPGFNIHCVAP